MNFGGLPYFIPYIIHICLFFSVELLISKLLLFSRSFDLFLVLTFHSYKTQKGILYSLSSQSYFSPFNPRYDYRPFHSSPDSYLVR